MGKKQPTMKKFTLLISLLTGLLSTQLNAQDTEHEYIPMAVEGAQWLISFDDISTYDEYADFNYSYAIQGDTIINSINYKKVYWRFVAFHNGSGGETNFILGPRNIFGAIRDDIENKQVYGISFSDEYGNARCEWTYAGLEENCPLDEEVLLYDFSLIEGDNFGELCSIEYSDSEIMQAMDQFLFGTWRFTQFTLYSVFTTEGIGSDNGLFESIYAEVSGWYHNVEGYCVGTDNECFGDYIHLETTDYETQEKIIWFYPNPVIKLLTIEKNSNYNIITIKIYNALGKLILKKTNNFYQTNIEALNTGLYTLQIQTENSIINKKFIKE